MFVPTSTELGILAQVADAHGLELRPQANESLARQLSTKEGLFLTTKEHCDCGTKLGSEFRQIRNGTHSPDMAARKLRAKGWSETKIARSLAQSQESVHSHAESELARWRDFLLAATAQGHAPYVGLLLHDYCGPLTEEIQLKAREHFSLRSVSTELLAKLERDVPYEFRA